MLITNALFFWFALTLLKKPLLAFIATLLFSINYQGNWDMYSSHCYCFFIERIIPVLFLLPSAKFLHEYLEKKRRRDAVLSFLLFFLGIGIGHWSVFATGFFLFYPISWSLFARKEKQRMKVALLGFLYLGITVFFVLIQRIHESGFVLKANMIDYLLHPGTYQWVEKIIRQFVYWSNYPILLPGILNIRMISMVNNIPAILSITPYVIIAYLLAIFTIYRSMHKRRSILIGTLLAIISIFYVNSFFGQYDVLYQPESNRYLYYPTMLLSIFWTLFLEVLLTQKKKWSYVLVVILISGYLMINARLIREAYVDSQQYNFLTKKVFEYIQKKAPSMKAGTLIVAPYDEVGVYESTFFTEQLKSKGITVMSSYNTYSNVESWENVAKKSSHLIMLEKDTTCHCIREHVIR